MMSLRRLICLMVLPLAGCDLSDTIVSPTETPTPVRVLIDGVDERSAVVSLLLKTGTDGEPEVEIKATTYGLAPQFGPARFTLDAFRRLLAGELIVAGTDTRTDVYGELYLLSASGAVGERLHTVRYWEDDRGIELAFGPEASDETTTTLKLFGNWPNIACYPTRSREKDWDPDWEFESEACRDWRTRSAIDTL